MKQLETDDQLLDESVGSLLVSAGKGEAQTTSSTFVATPSTIHGEDADSVGRLWCVEQVASQGAGL